MNKFIKLIPALLVLVMLLSMISACGEKAANDPTTAEPTADSTTTEAATTTEATEPTEPPTTKAPPTYTVVKEFNPEDWKTNAQLSNFRVEDKVLKFTSTGGDPSIALKSPLEMPAAEIDLIRIEIKNMTENDQLQLFFTNDITTGFNEAMSYKDTLDFIESDPAADEWTTLQLYTDECYDWEGTIKGIRIDPCNAAGDLEIRSITFLKKDAPAE